MREKFIGGIKIKSSEEESGVIFKDSNDGKLYILITDNYNINKLNNLCKQLNEIVKKDKYSAKGEKLYDEIIELAYDKSEIKIEDIKNKEIKVLENNTVKIINDEPYFFTIGDVF